MSENREDWDAALEGVFTPEELAVLTDGEAHLLAVLPKEQLPEVSEAEGQEGIEKYRQLVKRRLAERNSQVIEE